MRASPRPYTDADESAIRSGMAQGVSFRQIASDLGRTDASLCTYISRLRRDGKLPGFTPRTVQRHQRPNVDAAPALVLRDDVDLVAACLAQGGFPRAVITRVGTVWAGHDGRPWRGPVLTNRQRANRRSPVVDRPKDFAGVHRRLKFIPPDESVRASRFGVEGLS